MIDVQGAVIGVAGCGAMGLPMARCLVKAGLEVWGYDVKERQHFGDFAERMLDSAAQLSQRCDVVISVVRDQPQTDQLLFGRDGLLQSTRKMQVLVLSSTLDPNYVRKTAQRLGESLCLLDAPMSGAPIAAESAELSIMLAGDKQQVERLLPVFAAMGTHLHRMGEGVGDGHTAKVLNNFSAAMSVAVTRQLMQMAQGLGLSQQKLFEVMNSSSGQNWFTQNFERISWSREGYDSANTIGILEKDVGCFTQAVQELAGTELLDLQHALVEALRDLQPLDGD